MNSIMNEVQIYILPLSFVKDNYSFIVSKVNKDRVEKALRFVNEKDQLLSLGGAYLFYKYLPKEEIKINSNGKPYLENGPYFNLSHSGEYTVIAISNERDVGVDIERIDESKIEAIKYSLSEDDKKNVGDNNLFLLWSNKESLVKCMGTGFIDFKKVNGLPLIGARNGYYTISQLYEGYSLSVTLKGNDPFITKIKLVNFLEE